jgi:hypothetical protein
MKATENAELTGPETVADTCGMKIHLPPSFDMSDNAIGTNVRQPVLHPVDAYRKCSSACSALTFIGAVSVASRLSKSALCSSRPRLQPGMGLVTPSC